MVRTLVAAAALALAAAATAAPGGSATLVAAGDIALCGSTGDDATAALLDGLPGPVQTLGDNVQGTGDAYEFSNCFDPTWGRHKDRIHPAAGNHEYVTDTAANPYFDYFGAAAGTRGKGWYSYDTNGWHVVVLNTNDASCRYVPCGAGSEQERWLRADLAASTAKCTVAVWHHPRWSSGGTHGSHPHVQALWQAVYDAGVELVLSGHDHHYERFAPLNASGVPDATHGVRQFIVGTGGTTLRALGTTASGSEVRQAHTHGLLELTLGSGTYSWRFVPVAGKTFTDSGSGSCHDAPGGGGNLVPNPGFESGVDGWRSWQGALSLVSGQSGNGARVTPAEGARAASAFPSPKPVASTADGSYSASAWVRGSTSGLDLCLTIRAWADGVVTGSRSTCVVSTGAWQRLEGLTYEPGAGRQLEVFAVGSSASTGFTFDVDGVYLGRLAEPPPPQNLLPNGGFEGGLTGWRSWQGSLSLVAGVSGSAARVSLAAGSAYSIYPSPKPVASTAGTYTAAASVRAALAGRTLCIAIREWSSGTVVGAASQCLGATTSWQRFPALSYTSRGGGSLETYVYATGASAGDSFDVDDVVLTAG